MVIFSNFVSFSMMSPEINIMAQGVALPQFDMTLLKAWIEQVALAHGQRVGRLTYLFCDDAHILQVNRQFLGHDYYTDIITFDYSTSRRIAGDMVISLDTVRTNAEAVSAAYSDELCRVVIHGVLHLCGINDKAPGEREVMERHENEALRLRPAGLIQS